MLISVQFFRHVRRDIIFTLSMYVSCFKDLSIIFCMTLVNIDLADLLELIKKMTARWRELGTNLCVPEEELESIDGSLKVIMCLKRVLVNWIRRKGSQATLSALTKALKSSQRPNKALAYKLVKQGSKIMDVLQQDGK